MYWNVPEGKWVGTNRLVLHELVLADPPVGAQRAKHGGQSAEAPVSQNPFIADA